MAFESYTLRLFTPDQYEITILERHIKKAVIVDNLTTGNREVLPLETMLHQSRITDYEAFMNSSGLYSNTNSMQFIDVMQLSNPCSVPTKNPQLADGTLPPPASTSDYTVANFEILFNLSI